MHMVRKIALAILLLLLPGGVFASPWQSIGAIGNAADDTGYGAVDYTYFIGRHEVTNSQYTVFLNAVAKVDTYTLFHASMESDATHGGITQSGVSGSYKYAVKAGKGSFPVTYATFWSALRYANWLHNGQPSGLQDDITEDGAYTITTAGIAANSVARNLGAKFFLPSEDEWYKAAYYNPVTPVYYNYPASADAATTCAVVGGGANIANCGSQVATTSEVGAYTGSYSPSGLFDAGGNVREWTERIIGANRITRGGGYTDLTHLALVNTAPNANVPGTGLSTVGFRVAGIKEVRDKARFAIFGDQQFGNNCIGPPATSYAWSTAAFDWVIARGDIDAAFHVGDTSQNDPINDDDCECYGTADPGDCGDIDHSVGGTSFCTVCGNADAIACTGGTPGIGCEFTRMRANIDKLEVAGIPWLNVAGNHDRNGDIGGYANWDIFNQYFGVGLTTGLGLEQGATTQPMTGTVSLNGPVGRPTSADSYVVVEGGGQRFLIIALSSHLEDAAVYWARDLIDSHPGMPTIIMSHVIHAVAGAPDGWTASGFFGNGAKFLTSFKDKQQVFLHLCGHQNDVMSFEDTSEEYRLLGAMVDYSYDDTVDDHTLFDGANSRQLEDYGGGGAVAIMTIDVVAGQVSQYVYSPELGEQAGATKAGFDVHNTDANFRSLWSEKIQFCGTSGRFKMDPGACTEYREVGQ